MPESSAKRSRISPRPHGRCKTQLFNRSGQRKKHDAVCSFERASANPRLMEPQLVAEEKLRKNGSPDTRSVSFAPRDTRSSIGMVCVCARARAIDGASNGGVTRDDARIDRDFLPADFKKHRHPRSISLNASPTLRKLPFDILRSLIDIDNGETRHRDKEIDRFRIVMDIVETELYRNLTARIVYVSDMGEC